MHEEWEKKYEGGGERRKSNLKSGVPFSPIHRWHLPGQQLMLEIRGKKGQSTGSKETAEAGNIARHLVVSWILPSLSSESRDSTG